jgi:hypothetical protein
MQKTRLSQPLAFGIVFLAGLLFTALTLLTNETLASFVNLIPGILAVAVLLAAGFRLEDCFLKPGKLSGRGGLYLLVTILMMPILYLTGRWTGWDWTAALFHAPASAVSQELFFRCALLPVCLVIMKGKPVAGVLLHAFLFALWHLPKVAQAGQLAGIIAVVVFTFICGILWGLQVQRDRTVFWLVGLHALVLVINSMFTWG